MRTHTHFTHKTHIHVCTVLKEKKSGRKRERRRRSEDGKKERKRRKRRRRRRRRTALFEKKKRKQKQRKRISTHNLMIDWWCMCWTAVAERSIFSSSFFFSFFWRQRRCKVFGFCNVNVRSESFIVRQKYISYFFKPPKKIKKKKSHFILMIHTSPTSPFEIYTRKQAKGKKPPFLTIPMLDPLNAMQMIQHISVSSLISCQDIRCNLLRQGIHGAHGLSINGKRERRGVHDTKAVHANHSRL